MHPLDRILQSLTVDDTLFVGWKSLESHFPPERPLVSLEEWAKAHGLWCAFGYAEEGDRTRVVSVTFRKRPTPPAFPSAQGPGRLAQIDGAWFRAD